ncbi:hypothetical protein GCM10009616_18390 [Microlunatus lacustris]
MTKPSILDDQILVAAVYADPQAIAEDVALYAAGFNASWLVIPRPGMGWVVLARSSSASLFVAVLSAHPEALTEADLPR